jgi:hypothetical protein
MRAMRTDGKIESARRSSLAKAPSRKEEERKMEERKIRGEERDPRKDHIFRSLNFVFFSSIFLSPLPIFLLSMFLSEGV